MVGDPPGRPRPAASPPGRRGSPRPGPRPCRSAGCSQGVGRLDDPTAPGSWFSAGRTQVGPFHRRHQHRPVQVLVAPLARGLRAGTGRRGTPPRAASSPSADGGAPHRAGREAHSRTFSKRLVQVPAQLLRLAQATQARRASPRCRGPRCRSAPPPSGSSVPRVPGVDPLPDARPSCSRTRRPAGGSGRGRTSAAARTAGRGSPRSGRARLPSATAWWASSELPVVGAGSAPAQSWIAVSENWKKIPSPRISEAGTQVGSSADEPHPLVLGELRRAVVVAGRLDPGEADQGPDLTQPLDQDDLLEVGRRSRPGARPPGA